MRNCLSFFVALAICSAGCFCLAIENEIPGVIEAQRDEPCGVIFPCEEVEDDSTKEENLVSQSVADTKRPPETSNRKVDPPAKLPAAKLISLPGGQPEFEGFWMKPTAEKLTAAVIVESFALKSPQASMEKRMSAAEEKNGNSQNTAFITLTVLCTGAAVFGLVAAGFGFHRLRQKYKSAEEAEYPRYGITGPAKPRLSGDDKLASGAQLQHYQHTKQQIIVMSQPKVCNRAGENEESDDSECEGADADFSVFECPGLASTGNIEVNNPLFADDGAATLPPAREG